jgi:Ser/Thr protein kinase RdoA (MazF antagonist)
MAVSEVSHANLVAQVLAKHWRISERAIRTHLGVSRATWRVGQLYWLSQAEQTRSAALFQQANLLFGLDRLLRSEHSSIAVPEIVATDSGSFVVVDAGYVWCLTRNLEGFHVDVAAPGMYPVFTEGLARFHKALRAFSDLQLKQAPDGICVRARQNIERLSSEPFVAFTSDPHENEVLQQAAAWLLPRLDRLELLPRQLIHGDWTPPNALFDRADQPIRLTAVLDFEAMSWDSVHVDLANICSTLLMWSGLDRLEKRIASVVDTYERASGVHLEWDDIETAMLAHWFCHYWSWRDRLQHGEFGREVKDRLCLRISSVLSFVSQGTANSGGRQHAGNPSIPPK